MRASRIPVIASAIACGVFLAMSAGAETRRFGLEYRADAACPGEAELVRQVEARVPGATRVAGTARDVDAKVEVERYAERFRARIDLRAPDGSVRRDVDGVDCTAVVRAVALIVALALDPDARESEAREARFPTPPDSTPAAVSAARGRRSASSGQNDESTLWFGGGVLAGAMGGVAPTLAFYQGAYAELGVKNTTLSPSFRLAVFRAQRSTETDFGGLEMRLFAMRASGCPVRLGARWFAEACATFDAGRLQGRGYATVDPKTQHSAWYGPGAALEMGGSFLGALSIGFEFEAVALLARDRFFFAPDLTAHRVPGLAGYVGFGLGLRS